MEMKENSVKEPIWEPVEPVAPTTRTKTKSVEFEELSLDKPIFEASPFVVISRALSVISAFIAMLFSLLVFAACVLIFCLDAANKWLMKTTEKLNAKGKERESHVNRGETKNFLEASFSGKDKETRNTETNNPNRHGNYKENRRLYASVITGSQTVNSVDHGYAIDNCFNNYGDGEQDYSYCEVNSSTSRDSYNNHASGLQALSGANIWTSKSEDAFNNMSIYSQTYRGAKIGNSEERKAIRRAYNNGKNGVQNYDGYTNLLGKHNE
ncbi:hypothetical protein LR48_Vigan205s007000 [Vigna angularis]|uniref:Uncharacterized protein n=2 Tax=Phaseolus angularis TaxID=3914 RepID=A0A0L9T5R8_PHAAN|nr:uncharacterized protein LOC108319352 isoform X2 [Vigna angularis]KOM25933.1 hypothetical protein LR48_Vigan205s007000 [Vigna angularis]